MEETQVIGGYQFNLNDKIYLHHPNNKFWEISVKGKQVLFRVGKLNGQQESAIQQVNKTYSTPINAKDTARVKILEKLTKGYFSKTAKSIQQKKQSGGIKKTNVYQQKSSVAFSGQYYQKADQSIQLEINQKKVKITRIGPDRQQRFEIRTMESNEKAIQFCLQQEAWYLSQGYKANHSKFKKTFLGQDSLQPFGKSEKQTKPKQGSSKGSNFLSITHMTDQAISHRSRNTSSCKSDRSYVDNGQQNQYKTSKLGPSTSGCISVLLAQTWSDQVDPTGWIMSQKLDGVRCFWTGTMMYSRNGNRFYPPKFFTKNWPKSQLDGELFIDRGQFSKTISAIKKNVPIDSQWEKVKYLVFDCPGLKQPFKKRVQMMEQVIKQIDNPYIKCHFHRVCNGYTDLFEQLEKVNKIQGQGLMLRDPEAFYQNRRSKSLLKVKTFHDDQAVILGYKPGTGRCAGMVGALRVRNTHGIEFQVGSGMNDDMRRKPPKIGTKITYKYQQFNKDSGKPRFPTFLRVFEEKI